MKFSSGVIIAQRRTEEGEIELLCLRCYNNWDFPKGEREATENGKDTAIREVKEETDLDIDVDFQVSDQTTPSIVYGSGKNKKTASYFLGHRISSKDPNLLVDPKLGVAENHEYRWVKLSELRTTMPKRFGPIIDFLETHYKNQSDL